MTSILFVIGHFFATNSNAIMFKTKIFYLIFCCISEMYITFRTFRKKGDPHKLCISEINDCERRGYLNV